MNIFKNEVPDLILDVKPFNLKYTLECGQCFRWIRYKENGNVVENTYLGVIKDRVIKINQNDGKLYIFSNDTNNLKEVVQDYFDLKEDYKAIEEEISTIDENVNKAVKNTIGTRILNQYNFETLMSYIISANNNIPRIARSVNTIAEKYGKKVNFEDRDYYLFPSAEDLKDVSEEEFQRCGVGFRARYLKHTVKDILDGKIDLKDIENIDTENAEKLLLSLQGVGPKVADCILLFSYSRKDVFPVDVWVKRVMENLYFKKATSLKDISIYAKNNFGRYAGIVQQHLFYNIREGMM